MSCGVAAAVLAAAGLFPFETVKALLLPYLPPGKGDLFTVGRYSQAVTGTRVLSIVMLALAIVLFRAAVPLGRRLSSFGRDLRSIYGVAIAGVWKLRDADRLHLAALGAIILWTVILRFAFLNEAMRWDESDTFLSFASRPLFVGLAYYTPNNHLLNTLLMHLSYSVFGVSPWALRLPTVIAGVFIVPLTYASIRVHQGRDTALLAAALASASFPLIEYSTNARGYSIGTAFFLLMILLAGLGIRGERAAWTLLPATAALAIYSVPTMCFGVAGLFAWVLMTTKSAGRVLLLSLAAVAATLVLYAPPLAVTGSSSLIHNQWVAPLQLREFLARIPFALSSLWEYWNMRLPVFLAVLIALGVVASVIIRVAHGWSSFPMLLAIVLVSAAMVVFQRVHPPRRAWLFLLPVYLGAAAEGWSFLCSRFPQPRWVIPVLAVVLSGWMGLQVVRGGSLYRPGGEKYKFHNAEEYGFPNAEAFAMTFRDRLEHGATLVSAEPHTLPVKFQMFAHRISYRPSPSGDLLIITKPGETPYGSGIRTEDIQVLGKVATYQYADVYVGKRTAQSRVVTAAPP